MFAVLIGVLAGLAVSVGPAVMFDARVSSYAESLVLFSVELATSLWSRVPWVRDDADLVAVLSVVTALTMPGLVALALVTAARSTVVLRRGLAVAMMVGGLMSFAVLEPAQAGWLLVGGFVVAVVLLVPAGFVASAALWGLATVICVDQVLAVWSADSEQVTAAASAFSELSGFGSFELWQLVATAFALVPVAFAGVAALRSVDS